MKITFLGTGVFSGTRANQGILFEEGEERFLIDCCAGGEIIHQLKKVGILDSPRIKNIFLTHRHPDHSFGLPFYLFNERKEAENVNIIGSHGTITNMKKIINFCGMGSILKNMENKIKWIVLEPQEKIEISGDIFVKPFKVIGRENPGDDDFGYIIKVKNKKITISGDTGSKKEIIENAKDSDILIHECLSLDSEKKWAHFHGHSTAKDVGITASKANVKKVILTHIHSKYENRVDELIDEVKKYFSGPVLEAKELSVFYI